MADHSSFICPRPRARRACENCRTRKIRCLPDVKGANQGTCRRCSKFGLDCLFKESSEASGHKPRQSSGRANGKTEQTPSEDIVSQLFQSMPVQNDDRNSVQERHRRIFQDHFANEDLTNLDPVPRRGSPSNQEVDGALDLENTVIGLQEADELLSLFKQRHAYFPFITVPKALQSHEMARTTPFLLLAILTVCSTRRPRLHRRTEERFRRILSEKVIVQGQKSLEYVQGLLVYLAWYPFHFRPTALQHLQFLRIATGISSDLGLSDAPRSSAPWQASLGCYYLGSLFSAFKQQPVDITAQDLLQRALNEEFATHIQDPIEVHYTMFHKLLEDICTLERELNRRHRIPESGLQCQRDMERFMTRLHSLEASLPKSITNTVPMQIKRHFLRIRITALSMTRAPTTVDVTSSGTKKASRATILQHARIESAISCFNEVQAFLEKILAIPSVDYYNFSIREWFELIHCLVVASRTCLANGQAGDATIAFFQGRARTKMLIYLESIIHRMGSLSASTTGCPDVFCMFKSVLEILIPLYTPKPSQADDHATYLLDVDTASSSCQTEDNVTTPGTSASRCPVVNGSIKETEFWRELGQAGTWNDFDNEKTQQSQTEDIVGNGLDFSCNPPQSPDWMSIFNEWVVDFNMVE